MTAVAAVAAPVPGVVPGLARLEARRLLRHPVMLLGFGFWVAGWGSTALGNGLNVVQAFETTTSGLSFFPGIPAILAAHLVATRDRRAGSLDMLTSAAARSEERVRALCWASFAPALVALVLQVCFVVGLYATVGYPQAPEWGHVVQGPVTVLGACLLGTMLGVWLPSPVAPVVAMVGMYAAHIAIAEREPAMLFGAAVFWVDWGPYDGSVWVGLFPGSVTWHLVYLLGLCGMAAAAAVVRVAEDRRRPVALGLVSVCLAALGGLAQLP